MLDWLRRHLCIRRDTEDAGRWAIWMYQSSKEGYSAPLLLFVYEWERAGYRAPWGEGIVYSNDDGPRWESGDPGLDAFEQAYWFTELIAKGEARRVGPVPFEMPPPNKGRSPSEWEAIADADEQPAPLAD